MARTANLAKAKETKNDEFYTQWADIQKEVNAYLEFDPDTFRGKSVLLPCDDPEWSNFTKFFAQNFEAFGLRRLVSTSYAFASKKFSAPGRNRLGYWQPTLFESESPQYDAEKSPARGKIFVLDRDANGNGRIDIEDLRWSYLEGDGDFRSDEVRRLRDEADIVVTNPPFSLFHDFVDWLVEADRKFLVIGAMNAIKYKEVFPLIMQGRLWLGNGFQNGNAYFRPLASGAGDGLSDAIERSLGYDPLDPDEEDGVDEMAWVDIVQTQGQSYADSEAFSTLGYAFRGKATLDATQSLEPSPPNSIPTASFFKAAGCELISVAYGGATSAKRQIMNQADIFYFSGHGNHNTGTIQSGFTPAMVAGLWNNDLECAIIAGCAVLDVRNFRFNSLGLLYRWKIVHGKTLIRESSGKHQRQSTCWVMHLERLSIWMVEPQ